MQMSANLSWSSTHSVNGVNFNVLQYQRLLGEVKRCSQYCENFWRLAWCGWCFAKYDGKIQKRDCKKKYI